MAQAAHAYPWWGSVAGDSLAQGDLLRDFDVVVPTALPSDATDEVAAEIKTFDVIVMTQTCDIEHGRTASLLLCPWWDLWSFVDAAIAQGANWGRAQRAALLRGNLPGYHLLDEAAVDELHLGLGIVDFHEVYTAPTGIVRASVENAGKRLRLLPPYREHLGQAFARYFMRVGLPVAIPSDKIKSRPAS